MAASIVASLSSGNERVQPQPRSVLAGPAGGRDKIFEIRAMAILTKIKGMSLRFRQCEIDAFMKAGANRVIEPLLRKTLAPF